MMKDRIGELKAPRDERAGATITPQPIKTFARTARKRMRTDGGGCCRKHFRALAQRVEVDQKELRIMGSKNASAHARRR
jgi:site-specific DNA recombinase